MSFQQSIIYTTLKLGNSSFYVIISRDTKTKLLVLATSLLPTVRRRLSRFTPSLDLKQTLPAHQPQHLRNIRLVSTNIPLLQSASTRAHPAGLDARQPFCRFLCLEARLELAYILVVVAYFRTTSKAPILSPKRFETAALNRTRSGNSRHELLFRQRIALCMISHKEEDGVNTSLILGIYVDTEQIKRRG